MSLFVNGATLPFQSPSARGVRACTARKVSQIVPEERSVRSGERALPMPEYSLMLKWTHYSALPFAAVFLDVCIQSLASLQKRITRLFRPLIGVLKLFGLRVLQLPGAFGINSSVRL